MGHNNPLIDAYTDLSVKVVKIRELCQTGATMFEEPVDLAIAIMELLDE